MWDWGCHTANHMCVAQLGAAARQLARLPKGHLDHQALQSSLTSSASVMTSFQNPHTRQAPPPTHLWMALSICLHWRCRLPMLKWASRCLGSHLTAFRKHCLAFSTWSSAQYVQPRSQCASA